MEKIVDIVINNKFYTSIIIIVIALIFYTVISRTINKFIERDKNKNQRLDKKGRTIFRLFNNIIKYVIIIITCVLILQVYGVNVNSLVAGLGLVSVIAGLAIQDPLKDMISGMNIVSDNYFALGDVVHIDNFEGKVIEIGARTSKLKDIINGDILVIANRNISKTIKLSNQLYLSVSLSYEDETEKIDKILINICKDVKKLEHVIECEYLGLCSFEESSIIYKFKILCNPEFKPTVSREVNQILKSQLEKNGINIPYPQLTIHNG